MNSQCCDVVIHIDEELQDDDIHELSRDISCMPGSLQRLCERPGKAPDAGRLRPGRVQATELLSVVRQHGVGAELVGL